MAQSFPQLDEGWGTVVLDVKKRANSIRPFALYLPWNRPSCFLEGLGPARMNRVGENFPRSTATVLSVGIEYSISESGVSGSDRTLVADVPSLDLLKSQPEQRYWRRPALAQQPIELAKEGCAVAVIVIQNHDNRVDAGRPAK